MDSWMFKIYEIHVGSFQSESQETPKDINTYEQQLNQEVGELFEYAQEREYAVMIQKAEKEPRYFTGKEEKQI